MNMSRIAGLILAASMGALDAHPCPFDWNIVFAKDTEIKGENIGDFVAKFNEAVRKETAGKITEAIIYEKGPVKHLKVPEDSRHSGEMDALFKRHTEAMEAMAKKGLGPGAPIEMNFLAKFPVACTLAAMFDGGATNYQETKEGARIVRQTLECRAYHLSAKLLERVGEYQREDRIPPGMQPESYIFATFGSMAWAFDTYSESTQDYVQESFLEGVTHYIPEEKVILAIETKEKHEEMTKALTERGYLSPPVPDASPPKSKEAPPVPRD